MRGTVAKRLRRFAKLDTPDLPDTVVYTKVRMSAHSSNTTQVLDECKRQYYQLLKRLWKV